jgi:hypothetical protein
MFPFPILRSPPCAQIFQHSNLPFSQIGWKLRCKSFAHSVSEQEQALQVNDKVLLMMFPSKTVPDKKRSKSTLASSQSNMSKPVVTDAGNNTCASPKNETYSRLNFVG